jgi:zinc protease
MRAFYAARFANAADFTFFVVGAFTVDGITPLLTQWIASLPSTGQKASTFKDMGIRFPESVKTATVVKGREPASQSVMAFFADTQLQELEMHRARAAANVLSMRLRDILREQLGGTYGVNVSYTDISPLKGYGMMTVAFGSAPENVAKLQQAVLDEVARLKKEGPSADDVAKVQEMERRDLETSVRQNSYWSGSLQNVHLLGWDPLTIVRRAGRIESLSVPVLHEMFRKYFPEQRYTVVTLKPEATPAAR